MTTAAGALQLAFDLPHRPAMGGEDFLVAPSNGAAVAWLDRWPDWPAPALTLIGPPACGKSHLAQVWRARSGAGLALGAELGERHVAAMAEAPAPLAVDDAHRVAGHPGREQALFHLYNQARDAGVHLLLLSTRPPARWRIRLADLRSRLKAAPAATVEPPDDALLGAVLVKLFADRQIRVGAEVISLLLQRMERSFDAARHLVAALDGAALAAHRRITPTLAREVLARQDKAR